MKFLPLLKILALLFKLSLVCGEASVYCSKFNLYVYMTDMYEPSKVVYTLNATLEIAPGSNLTTNFTTYDIVETSPEEWHIFGFLFRINLEEYMCRLDDGIYWEYVPNCTVEIPELSKNMGKLYNIISDRNVVLFRTPKGTIRHSYIKLPAFYRGGSFDKISEYDFYAYSKFENDVSVDNITDFNRTVNIHTSCAGTTPGIDWKYVPNNGACDHLQASIQVMNASGDVLTQDSGCIKYRDFDWGSYLYQSVDFQQVANVFADANTQQFLNCLTYTRYNKKCSIKIYDIPGNEPIFWFLDYTIIGSSGLILAETSGAIALVLLCNSTSNCTYAKDMQFYIYDQPNSTLYNSPYSTNKTIHIGWVNECNLPNNLACKLNAKIELRCSNDENCPTNATNTTTTTTSTSQLGKTQSTTIKTPSKSYPTHMPDTNTTPNGASYSKQISLLAMNFMIISFIFYINKL